MPIGGGDAPGVVQIVDRLQQLPNDVCPSGLIVELHRQTDDLVALLGEQGRRHRRIHAAGHRYDDTHIRMLPR